MKTEELARIGGGILFATFVVALFAAMVYDEYSNRNYVKEEDVVNLCAARQRAALNRESHKKVLHDCVNAPRRLATSEDEEAMIVRECRYTAEHLYPVEISHFAVNRKELARANEICNF